MPNIIEQQDLLKGLPDSRLALLIQQPQGDIPPFLVAAEAQRRQAIRQQFASNADNTSVVDNLAQQLSKVPQNLNAPMQAPPKIPQGIAAIPQQVPQQGQQMADGGLAQRYAPNGQTFRVNQGTVSSPPAQDSYGFGVIPRVMDYVGNTASGLYNYLTSPSPEASQPVAEAPAGAYMNPPLSGRERVESANLTVAPRDPNAGQGETSIDNQKKPAEDEIRKRIEALYGDTEESGWEKAQKWFAASAQFLDPTLNDMQSLVGAASAFSQGAAQEAQQRREDERAREEALLKYDIGQADQQSQADAAFLKGRTDIATGQITEARRQQSDLAERIRDIQKRIDSSEVTDLAAAKADQDAYQRMIDDIGAQIASYQAFINKTYGFNRLPVVDLNTNTIR